MDAVEFIVTRDRMCKYERERGINAKNEPCPGCCIPARLNIRTCPPCEDFIKQHPAEAVEIVERWGKEHPRKTRQSEFLKMFPNALIFEGVLKIEPCELIDSSSTQKSVIRMMNLVFRGAMNAGKITGLRRLNNAIHGRQMPYIKQNSVYN